MKKEKKNNESQETVNHDGGKKNFTVNELLIAINGSKGIVSVVANKLGCAWSTAKIYIDQHEETKQALSDENETILDFAESKLYKRIDSEDMTAIKFLLATKGKRRGYTERTELTGADGDPIRYESQDKLDKALSKMTDKQIKAIEKLLID